MEQARTAGVLGEILAATAEEVARRAAARPLAELRTGVEGLDAPRGFIAAIERDLRRGGPAVIAEMKKASPSKGVMRASYDPAALARNYAEHGATCLSVLTDQPYFHGGDRDLVRARDACALPVLRKDFIIDPYQVFESRRLGADAILLIVAALGDPVLRELAELAHALGMDVLVEVHNGEELARALALPCRLVGINNRDLRTFETRLDTTLALLDSIPEDRIVVSESGLRRREDVVRLRRHNVHAFLVGEALMRAENPGEELEALFGLKPEPPTQPDPNPGPEP